VRGWIPGGGQFSLPVQTGPRVHPDSPSRGGRAALTIHPPPNLSTRLKKVYSHNSTPSQGIHVLLQGEILLFHGNSVYSKVPECYVIHILPVLFFSPMHACPYASSNATRFVRLDQIEVFILVFWSDWRKPRKSVPPRDKAVSLILVGCVNCCCSRRHPLFFLKFHSIAFLRDIILYSLSFLSFVIPTHRPPLPPGLLLVLIFTRG